MDVAFVTPEIILLYRQQGDSVDFLPSEVVCNLFKIIQVLQEIRPDLQHFGHRVATDINSMGRECELQPPKLEHFDAWGQRVDNIQTCQGWGQLHDVSAEEGLISIPYERKYGQWR